MRRLNSPETWKPVLGFEGYYDVSDLGRVRSLPRAVAFSGRRGKTTGIRSNKYRVSGRIMKTGPDSSGYSQVSLTYDGKVYVKRVHVLVLEAFVGPCPAGRLCRHFPDRDRTNNQLINLSWGTQKENCADQIAHGTKLYGEKTVAHKLTSRQVTRILKKLSSGISQSELAREFGVTRSSIGDIATGKCWGHLTGSRYDGRSKRRPALNKETRI